MSQIAQFRSTKRANSKRKLMKIGSNPGNLEIYFFYLLTGGARAFKHAQACIRSHACINVHIKLNVAYEIYIVVGIS